MQKQHSIPTGTTTYADVSLSKALRVHYDTHTFAPQWWSDLIGVHVHSSNSHIKTTLSLREADFVTQLFPVLESFQLITYCSVTTDSYFTRLKSLCFNSEISLFLQHKYAAFCTVFLLLPFRHKERELLFVFKMSYFLCGLMHHLVLQSTFKCKFHMQVLKLIKNTNWNDNLLQNSRER